VITYDNDICIYFYLFNHKATPWQWYLYLLLSAQSQSYLGSFVIKQVEVNTDIIVIGSFVIKQVEVNTDTIVMG
jgi:hypothetical protein